MFDPNDLGGLDDLYQEVILDHYRSPRNFGDGGRGDREAEGYNPLCGDRVTVSLALEGERVIAARFQGKGCAISTASASMMTDAVRGKTRGEVDRLFEDFQRMVRGERPPVAGRGLGKLEVFSGVSEFPVRVKCATLAWHTLKAAMEDRRDVVSTE